MRAVARVGASQMSCCVAGFKTGRAALRHFWGIICGPGSFVRAGSVEPYAILFLAVSTYYNYVTRTYLSS